MTLKEMDETIIELTDIITKLYKTPLSNIDIRKDVANFTQKQVTYATIQIGDWEIKLSKWEGDTQNEKV